MEHCPNIDTLRLNHQDNAPFNFSLYKAERNVLLISSGMITAIL